MSIMLLLIISSLGLLILSLLFSYIHEYQNHHQHSRNLHKPSRNFGPPSHPIIGCLVSFYRNRRRLLDWYTDLLSKSPTQTIVVNRLGARRTVVTANPDNVEYMLKTNFPNFPKGQPFTDLLGDLLGRGIFNVDGGAWSTQRKLASHEFNTRTLREFVVNTLEDEAENRLVPVLLEAERSGSVLDLQEVLKRFTFDTICKVSLGTDPCCLDRELSPLPPLVEAFESASKICAMRGMAPVYAVWKAKRVMGVGSEKELKEAVRTVHGSVDEIIKNKKKVIENDQEKQCGGDDLLSRLLLAGHDGEVARDMVISFIMAGRDTTSSAMTWLFWLLAEHGNVENLIVEEVVSLLGSDGNERAMDFEVLKEMDFLKASLCESMRLYPPVAWDSKHAAADDVLPDGTPVRKGDRVTYFPYGMGRMEELWGEDRFEFKPDRWFDEPGVLKTVSPYKYPVFQAGPRVCLGKEMAFIQMKYVVASILRRFEIRPVCFDRPVFVPLLTAHMAGGLKVLVRKRGMNGSLSDTPK